MSSQEALMVKNSAGDTAEVITGAYTGVKGLRVYGGPTDPISDIPVFIDSTHHQGHEGESYGVQYYSAAPANIEFALTVGDFGGNTISCPHLVMTIIAYGGAVQLDLYEGSTFTGGTPMTAFNRNRNSMNVPVMTISSGVTITGGGTLLPHTILAAAAEKQGDTNRSGDEVILKENTIYRVKLEEITVTTRVIVHFEWYEDEGI